MYIGCIPCGSYLIKSYNTTFTIFSSYKTLQKKEGSSDIFKRRPVITVTCGNSGKFPNGVCLPEIKNNSNVLQLKCVCWDTLEGW